MTTSKPLLSPHVFTLLLVAAVGLSMTAAPTALWGVQDPPKAKKKKPDKEKEDPKADDGKQATPAPREHIRWGKRRNETDEAYDKRHDKLLKRIKKDKKDDIRGGPVPLWTVSNGPFIIRTDISAEFTADTAMYMEMLHREYGAAYKSVLGPIPSVIKEPIEVVVFADRETYMKNGGTPGSGGFFAQSIQWPDRAPTWPAAHYRLQQFTDGITDFALWPKGTLKHEAAHMELQMRLGLFVDTPRWFNEGHASVFEWWDFDKTTQENLDAIPFRGRYAPFIRRIYGTDMWKDFHYVWTIDAATWHRDMTSRQGYLNYCQAWSLAAYMMNNGKEGYRDFRKIYDLSKRVGADRRVSRTGTKTRAWELQFPDSDQKELEKNWMAWVAEKLPRDGEVPDESYFLRRNGINPSIRDKLEPFTEDEIKAMKEQLEKEDEERKGRIEK